MTAKLTITNTGDENIAMTYDMTMNDTLKPGEAFEFDLDKVGGKETDFDREFPRLIRAWAGDRNMGEWQHHRAVRADRDLTGIEN